MLKLQSKINKKYLNDIRHKITINIHVQVPINRRQSIQIHKKNQNKTTFEKCQLDF